MAHEVEGNMINEFDMGDDCYGLGELTVYEIELIQECRKSRTKVGNFWLTPEGRAEIRDCWDNPNDGNIVLPLLNELERLEEYIRKMNKDK